MLTTQTKKQELQSESAQGAEQSLQAKNPSHAEISKKAYELYEKRGRQDAKDRDDWLKAEQWCKQNKVK